jgi:hypothetical protein
VKLGSDFIAKSAVGAGSTMTELGGPYSQSFLPSLDGLQAGGEWAAQKNTRNLGKAPVRVRNVSRGTLTGFNTFAVGGAVDIHYLATRGHRLIGNPIQPLKGYFLRSRFVSLLIVIPRIIE